LWGVVCLAEELRECVEEVRSVSDGRLIGEGDAEGIVPSPSITKAETG
jgi:hypothetical protein